MNSFDDDNLGLDVLKRFLKAVKSPAHIMLAGGILALAGVSIAGVTESLLAGPYRQRVRTVIVHTETPAGKSIYEQFNNWATKVSTDLGQANTDYNYTAADQKTGVFNKWVESLRAQQRVAESFGLAGTDDNFKDWTPQRNIGEQFSANNLTMMSIIEEARDIAIRHDKEADFSNLVDQLMKEPSPAPEQAPVAKPLGTTILKRVKPAIKT